MICLAVSPIPIGLTSGFLSNAISQQDRKGAILTVSTNSVQSLRAVSATQLIGSGLERGTKFSPAECVQAQWASSTACVYSRTADLMAEASKDSKRTGCTSGGPSLIMES